MKTIRSLPLLFTSLCLSAFAGAQTGTTLLVKTDMSCNWKLDGQPMGHLQADDPKVVLVSPGKHLIVASAADGVATIRTKVDVDKVEKTVEIQLKSRNDEQSKMQYAEAAGQSAAANVAASSTWNDPRTGLMWTREDNGSDVDWTQANAYCSKLRVAGYKGWRLPTLEELQGIHDPSIDARKMVSHGVTHDVHVRGNLKLTGSEWSSSLGDGAGTPWQWAWWFNFGDAGRGDDAADKPGHTFITFDFSMRALCVRLPENVVDAR